MLVRSTQGLCGAFTSDLDELRARTGDARYHGAVGGLVRRTAVRSSNEDAVCAGGLMDGVALRTLGARFCGRRRRSETRLSDEALGVPTTLGSGTAWRPNLGRPKRIRNAW